MSDLAPNRLAALLRRRATKRPLELPPAGGSMGRRWERVERLLITPGTRPSRGEVWMFVDPTGRTVAHRCRRAGEPARFRGDGNLADDAPVSTDRLVGRVTAVERGGRWYRLGARERARGAGTRSVSAARRIRDGVRRRVNLVRRARFAVPRPVRRVLDQVTHRRR